MEISIGNFTIKVPADYQQVNSLPGDPVGSISFMKKTPVAACLAMYNSISSEQSMPFNSKEEVIRNIHNTLEQDQGVIEVESGITPAGKKYIYSIIKTFNRGGIAIKYSLSLHIGHFADRIFETQAVFDGIGDNAVLRDAAVYNILQKEGKIGVGDPDVSNWAMDPYDSQYRHGVLMNMSEKAEYDEAFPGYPLTEARLLVKNLIVMN